MAKKNITQSFELKKNIIFAFAFVGMQLITFNKALAENHRHGEYVGVDFFMQTDFENELWKNIPIYEGYMISNFGRVKRLSKISTHPRVGDMLLKERLMALHENKMPKRKTGGYLRISFCYDKRNVKVFVHRLVAESFVEGKTIERKFVNHIDGNKLNNHYTNLEWVTPCENIRHAFATGLRTKENMPHNRYYTAIHG